MITAFHMLCSCWFLLFGYGLYCLLSTKKTDKCKPENAKVFEKLTEIKKTLDDASKCYILSKREERKRQDEDHQILVQMSDYVNDLRKRTHARRNSA